MQNRFNRVDEMDASDEVKKYLRGVQRQRSDAFKHGHITAPPPPPPVSSSKSALPPRKRARQNSDEPEKAAAAVPTLSSSSGAVHSPSVASQQPLVSSSSQPTTLIAKWLSVASFASCSLEESLLPTASFVKDCCDRFHELRESLTRFRMGVELLREVWDGEEPEECWEAAYDVLVEQLNYDGPKRQRSVVRVSTVLAEPQPGVPDTPELPAWVDFVRRQGPSRGIALYTSTLALVDGASASSLLNVLLTDLLKKKMYSSFTYADSGKQDDEQSVSAGGFYVNSDEEDDAKEEDCGSCSGEVDKVSSHGGSVDDVAAPALIDDGPDEELLRTLRCLRSGYGQWLYGCLSAVELPIDPDTDRLLHEFVRLIARCLRRLGGLSNDVSRDAAEKLTPSRGWLLQAVGQDDDCRALRTAADVHRTDVVSLFTFLVLLAKFFKQNKNNLIAI